jgi:hypothetical protein
MADPREHTAEDLDEAERMAEAALKAIRERKVRAQEEAEEKRRAKEAEQEHQAEEAQKAEAAAEEARAAKAKAEKEEAEKIWAANMAMKEGLLAIVADKERDTAAAAWVKTQVLVKHQKELVKLGAPPDDPLMQAPEGPGPSQQELRDVQREFSGEVEEEETRGG